jgi:hypothetical protein
MGSGKAHAVALDKVVEINGGLARHDVKSRAGLGPVGMVRGSGFLTEFKSVRKRSHADRDVFSIQSSTLQEACRRVAR